MTYWTWLEWLYATGITATALAISVWAGGRITMAVLRRAAHSSDASPRDIPAPDAAPSAPNPALSAADQHHDPADEPVQVNQMDQPLRGGLWIGRIERFATTLALLAGFPAAIAIIVAIKGLGRYPEIRKSPAASEKFVIGTLTSILIASLIGALARLALLSL